MYDIMRAAGPARAGPFDSDSESESLRLKAESARRRGHHSSSESGHRMARLA